MSKPMPLPPRVFERPRVHAYVSARMRPVTSVVLACSMLAGLAGLASTRTARADVILDRLAAGAIKFDGKVKEWPGTTPASEVVKPGKTTANFSAGYDEQGIWIGAEVSKDGALARTAAFGPAEDCVSLTIAFPRDGVARGTAADLVAYEVGFYAGLSGSSEGLVKMRAGVLAGKTVAGAKIVEAARKGGGYSLEAFVPWSAFPEARRTRTGLRGVLRVYDGDGSSVRALKATGPGSVDTPSSLGWLLTEPEQSIPAALAARKQSWRDVTYDVVADVAGDAMNERVLFVGRTLYVLGPTYKGGKQWLTMEVGSDVTALDVKDANGDGHSDLVVTSRVRAGTTTREAVHIYAFQGERGAEKPTHVFAHETLVEGGGAILRDLLGYGGGKKPTITISYAAPKGWTAATYAEPVATDIDPILLPWGGVKERVFGLVDGVFTKEKEVPQKATIVAPAAIAPPQSPALPPTSPAAPPSDLVAAALAQYRKEKGVERTARFELPLEVASGKTGRAALYGRDLVVAGAGGSTAYAFVTMARFASEQDVLDITAKDLTGDGRDDLIVRGVVRGKMTGPGGEQEVLRELLSVYALRGTGGAFTLVPVFNAEVARSIGTRRVETSLRIVTARGSTSGRIELGKGGARGWTEKTYPFGPEAPTANLEPLLLPWGKTSSVVYTWDGERFGR